MLAKYESVCYELLRPAEIKAIRERVPIAYIVAGSLEWHSFQNPLGTDGLKAHAICCEAALRYGGVVLPPLYQGLLGDANWGPEGWQGYTLGYNQPAMMDMAFLGIATALVRAGWQVLVGVTGHDVAPQRDALARAIERATAGTGARGLALMEGELHTPDEEISLRMDHAGAWETSCMLYAYPHRVDLETLRERQLSSDEDFEMRGPEGIGGKNPLKYASPELGQRIIERMGDLIGERAVGLLQAGEGG
jgi:creatinine amidohydrolase